MATIYTQNPRVNAINDEINLISVIELINNTIAIASNYNNLEDLTITEAIEIAKFAFHINDRDVHDEQMCGIAQCLDKISDR